MQQLTTTTKQEAATQDSDCIIEQKERHAGLSTTKHNTMINTGIKLLYKYNTSARFTTMTTLHHLTIIQSATITESMYVYMHILVSCVYLCNL